MDTVHDVHIELTKTVKTRISPLEIVFPSHYAKIYAQEAMNKGIDLHPDELLNSEMISEQVVHHIISLYSCTERAITAIENEDTRTLYEVLEETKNLRTEIDRLRKIVYEDTLTKSFNRKWFEDTYLEHDKATIREEGIMVMVDLNKFKHINDTYGHTVGDRVLAHVAQKLKESGGDVVRYGGDEFLVLFGPDETTESIRDKLEKIVRRYDRILFKIDSVSFKITFAYGISSFSKGSSFTAVIDTADKHMYHNKKSNGSL